MYLSKIFFCFWLIILAGMMYNNANDHSLYLDGESNRTSGKQMQDDSLSQGQRFIYEYVGLQLYSLRNELDKDISGTLAKAKQMGFRRVEVYSLHGLSTLDFRLQLEKYNLHCTSFMTSYESLQNNFKQVVEQARTLGATYVVCPWIPHQAGSFSNIEMQKAVKDFNNIGKKLSEQGFKFCYHLHGYEFKPYQEGTLFDYMVSHTDPQFVNFEMDVYYVSLAGIDPVSLLKKHPSRFYLIHLKDLKEGTPERNFTGKAPLEWSVPLGTGKIDLRDVLQQAQQTGIGHFYIEDESPNALQQIPKSLEYISKLSF